MRNEGHVMNLWYTDMIEVGPDDPDYSSNSPYYVTVSRSSFLRLKAHVLALLAASLSVFAFEQ